MGKNRVGSYREREQEGKDHSKWLHGLSDEGKLLYQNVELQKKIYNKINGLFWFFMAGSIFIVAAYVLKSL